MPSLVTVGAAVLSALAVAGLIRPPAGRRLVSYSASAGDRGALMRRRLQRLSQLPFGPAARRRREAARSATVEALAALAAELQAGAPAAQALRRAGPRQWPTAAAAVDRGAAPQDVVRALHRDAQLGGESASMLRALAMAWGLTATSGMALAPMVSGIAAWARAQEDVRGEVQAQLAAPRATGRMLAVLPAFALAAGLAFGADPLGWLLGTPVGLACLLGGLALIGCGLAWMGHLSSRVERRL